MIKKRFDVGQRMKSSHFNTAIIGSGIVGIATAYYIKKLNPEWSVLLIEAGEPMAMTSAQSGENYRNWWPHPTMTAFTDHSIDLMEAIAEESNNQINMNRRGYALATRSDNTDTLMDELDYGYSTLRDSEIRIHTNQSSSTYQPPISPAWTVAPTGVDVINDQQLIRKTFPSFDPAIKTVIHIRRAGAISAQQMGQHMMQFFKQSGGQYLQADINAISQHDGFTLHTKNTKVAIQAKQLINAAGPFIQEIAAMLSLSLPVHNTLQQKIAFEDTGQCIPRDMPFSIDLDDQKIDWTSEERQLLIDSNEHQWLTQLMPGSIHCRPEGGDAGTWLKLGWAFNNTSTTAIHSPALLDSFPEIVLRGAARLNPSLKHYYTRLPRSMHHYGGYYTLTDENWPLIGPMDTKGKIQNAYVVGAMSGFGTMSACAAGDLCARRLLGMELPEYAQALSPERYKDAALMQQIHSLSQKGIL